MGELQAHHVAFLHLSDTDARTWLDVIEQTGRTPEGLGHTDHYGMVQTDLTVLRLLTAQTVKLRQRRAEPCLSSHHGDDSVFRCYSLAENKDGVYPMIDIVGELPAHLWTGHVQMHGARRSTCGRSLGRDFANNIMIVRGGLRLKAHGRDRRLKARHVCPVGAPRLTFHGQADSGLHHNRRATHKDECGS